MLTERSLVSTPEEDYKAPKQRRAHSRVVVRIDVDGAAGNGGQWPRVGQLVIGCLAWASCCRRLLCHRVPTDAWLLLLWILALLNSVSPLKGYQLQRGGLLT